VLTCNKTHVTKILRAVLPNRTRTILGRTQKPSLEKLKKVLESHKLLWARALGRNLPLDAISDDVIHLTKKLSELPPIT
ncbi:MAG: hypothetical protein ACRECJ_03955, partial [Limisphaerales bacterium]